MVAVFSVAAQADFLRINYKNEKFELIISPYARCVQCCTNFRKPA
jgi:hypothetical protein